MKKSNKESIFLFFLIAAGLLFSAQETDRGLIIQQMINEAVAEKVQRFELARAKRCRELILAEAGRRADSIVIVMAKEIRVLRDTIDRPPAPERPQRPESLKPIDSTAAVPLLPDTVIMD